MPCRVRGAEGGAHANELRVVRRAVAGGRGDDPSDGRRRVDRARQDSILSVALDCRWLPSPEQLPALSLKATCRVRHVEVSVLGARGVRRVDWRGVQRRATDSGAVGSPRKESSKRSQGHELIYATRPGPVVTAGLPSRRSPNGSGAARRVGAALVRKGSLEHNLHTTAHSLHLGCTELQSPHTTACRVADSQGQKPPLGVGLQVQLQVQHL